MKPQRLTDEERATYEWQLWVPGHGEAGQEKLKGASVLITRVGGLGSVVAYELAAAGIGRLVLAHGGDVKPSDLNRQLLMTHESLGTSRVESARARLLDLNPRLQVDAVPENVSEDNVQDLVERVDLVVDCAPIFEERFLLNREAVRQRKPMVECAMYEMEAQITTIVPGTTPCLACLAREKPPSWTRDFPVFGAVSGSVGCIAAAEAVKLIAEFGTPLLNRWLAYDLRTMEFRMLGIRRDPDCPVCSGL